MNFFHSTWNFPFLVFLKIHRNPQIYLKHSKFLKSQAEIFLRYTEVCEGYTFDMKKMKKRYTVFFWYLWGLGVWLDVLKSKLHSYGLVFLA